MESDHERIPLGNMNQLNIIFRAYSLMISENII